MEHPQTHEHFLLAALELEELLDILEPVVVVGFDALGRADASWRCVWCEQEHTAVHVASYNLSRLVGSSDVGGGSRLEQVIEWSGVVKLNHVCLN